jgi:hypothetical protein
MIASQLNAQPPTSDERLRRESVVESEWTPLERFAFRFAFVYFTKFFCESLLDSGYGPRKVLAALSNPPVRWFANGVLHLPDSAIGGPRWVLVQLAVAFAIAAIIAAVWSALSHQTEYRRLRGWFFIGLRYYVGVVMSVYGGFKVIESQFPPISFAQLSQPLGSMAPMGLLWAFMGYSTLYATFAGIGESVGALLLFFRKTTTAGALILIAVLSNVALLNFAFDVPVKQLSSNLLFASIVLVVPDLRRLADVFLFNRPSTPANLSFDFRKPWIDKARRVLKPLIIVVATLAPLTISAIVHHNLTKRPPLFGLYDVDEFTRNGVAISSTDGSRWRRVAIDRGDVVAIRRVDDSASYFTSTIDTTKHSIGLRPRNGSSRIEYSYEPAPSGLMMRSGADGETITAPLRRLDAEKVYPLLRRR